MFGRAPSSALFELALGRRELRPGVLDVLRRAPRASSSSWACAADDACVERVDLDRARTVGHAIELRLGELHRRARLVPLRFELGPLEGDQLLPLGHAVSLVHTHLDDASALARGDLDGTHFDHPADLQRRVCHPRVVALVRAETADQQRQRHHLRRLHP